MMSILKDIATMILVSAGLINVTSNVAISQALTAVTSTQNVLMETFEGNDPSLMLSGQIDFHSTKSPWLVHISDGKLVLENRAEPQSVHYNDITWIKYPNSDILTTTENAVISVAVEGNTIGRGGAGILVGSGKQGDYLMFAVDEKGRFSVIRKQDQTTRNVHSAMHSAILVGEPNRLTFEPRGENIVFFVNGTEIIQIPNAEKTPGSHSENGQAGVGFAAFGTGTYTFDDVEISQGN